jgi:hypothetical protein
MYLFFGVEKFAKFSKAVAPLYSNDINQFSQFLLRYIIKKKHQFIKLQNIVNAFFQRKAIILFLQ